MDSLFGEVLRGLLEFSLLLVIRLVREHSFVQRETHPHLSHVAVVSRVWLRLKFRPLFIHTVQQAERAI